MAFNLYFAVAGTQPVLDFKYASNTNQLFSQLYERTAIKKWIKNVSNINECKLFIDSGAFSAHTKGKSVDIDEYIKFLNDYDEFFHIFAELDKIPGEFRKPKTLEQCLEAPKISWDNYLYMKDRLKSRDKLLPVFHQGESFDWLKNMLEYKHPDTGTSIKYIGISPANDSNIANKQAFCEKCFELIQNSSNPHVHTHAFGMTSLHILEAYPFTSADSTSYLMCAVNGGIMTEKGVVTLSDRRFDNNNALYLTDKSVLNELVSKYGFTIDELSTNTSARMIYNIKYLLDWCEHYEYKPNTLKPINLF